MGDPPDEITVAVSETASDALETPIEDLPPLSETIDLDGLDAIIPSTPVDSDSTVTVTFSYAGLHVLVCPGNTVYVQPIRGENKDVVDLTNTDRDHRRKS